MAESSEKEKSQSSMQAGHSLSTLSVDSGFEELLEKAVNSLKNDFVSGARQMADAALFDLSSMIAAAAEKATNNEELWKMTVEAAKQLSDARPSMSAAITSTLLRALDLIHGVWEDEREKSIKTPTELAKILGSTIASISEKRKHVGMQVGKNFASWLEDYTTEHTDQSPIEILTLSNSSTIRNVILTAVTTLPDLELRLSILESRPRFEGADMAAQILSSLPDAAKSRLSITLFPDCAVGAASRTTHIVLLGADRISSSGDVFNKIGSLSAVLCAKSWEKKPQVVVVSDGDKIVAPGMDDTVKEEHPASEMTGAWSKETREGLKGEVQVFGEWFEWVRETLVDVYVTEMDILDKEGVEKVGVEIEDLRGRIFGESAE